MTIYRQKSATRNTAVYFEILKFNLGLLHFTGIVSWKKFTRTNLFLRKNQIHFFLNYWVDR